MRPKIYVLYSEVFKKEVVRKVQEEGLGQERVRQMYGIGSRSTIPRWLKQYGNPSLLSTKIIVMKAKEQDKASQQAARIKELEQALVAIQLKHLESEALLEIACEELGRDRSSLKKKVRSKSYKKPRS